MPCGRSGGKHLLNFHQLLTTFQHFTLLMVVSNLHMDNVRSNCHIYLFWLTEPMLIWPTSLPPPTTRMGGLVAWGGANGPLAQFLDDFGPVLLEKYKPRGIVVFSAHWETTGERLGKFRVCLLTYLGNSSCRLFHATVTDYGDENPLLMDYYNFVPEVRRHHVTDRHCVS